MTEQESKTLIETEARSKSNVHRLDSLEQEIKDVRSNQEAIYKIASSVELIAQRVSYIEKTVDDTNQKVDAQTKAWAETERRLTERVNETETKPYKTTSDNVNSIRVSIITAICTAIVSGLLAAAIAFMR